jgi:hypothetical protein
MWSTCILWYMCIIHMYYGMYYVSPKCFTVYLLVKKKYIIEWTLEWTPPPEGPLKAYVCVYVYTDVNTYVHTSVWEWISDSYLVSFFLFHLPQVVDKKIIALLISLSAHVVPLSVSLLRTPSLKKNHSRSIIWYNRVSHRELRQKKNMMWKNYTPYSFSPIFVVRHVFFLAGQRQKRIQYAITHHIIIHIPHW